MYNVNNANFGAEDANVVTENIFLSWVCKYSSTAAIRYYRSPLSM
jgi:hypothetical protein